MVLPERSLTKAAARCLQACEAADKVNATLAAADDWDHGRLTADHTGEQPPMRTPGYPERLHCVHPLRVPRRRLNGAKGRVAAVHALAHIEFNAINLAWDCVYRYAGLPLQFYGDWVRVAREEAFHFCLLSQRLEELGSCYGELQAHNGLWEMAEKTSGDLAARMAMVPRFLEARGLDVTPSMIHRFRRAGDTASSAILQLILRDEIGHVAVGSRWFRHACRSRGADPDTEFATLVGKYARGSVRGPLHTAHRREAGFSDAEIEFLEDAVEGGPASPDRSI